MTGFLLQQEGTQSPGRGEAGDSGGPEVPAGPGLPAATALRPAPPSARRPPALGYAPRPAARGRTPPGGSRWRSAARTCPGGDREPGGFSWQRLFFSEEFHSAGWNPGGIESENMLSPPRSQKVDPSYNVILAKVWHDQIQKGTATVCLSCQQLKSSRQ